MAVAGGGGGESAIGRPVTGFYSQERHCLSTWSDRLAVGKATSGDHEARRYKYRWLASSRANLGR